MEIKRIVVIACLFILTMACSSDKDTEIVRPELEVPMPDKLKVGYSLSVNQFNDEKLSYAKSVGIDYVEAAAITSLFNSNGQINKTDAQLEKLFTDGKAALDKNGVEVWSIHMAYGQNIDISVIDEGNRKDVVERHKKVLNYIKLLKPKYILFHPSYYLEPNQRDLRKNQLIKSLIELDEYVRSIGSTLVVENMLGPELMSGERERPLMRTVEECQEIFKRLPSTIGLAVDMNHIAQPEKLIRAMGDRLKTVHIADGSGRAENHYLPCSGLGANNWVEILKALDEVNYEGVFMYECDYNDEKELVQCYDSLFHNYVKAINK